MFPRNKERVTRVLSLDTNRITGQVSEKRFQEAIDDIVKQNNMVDQDHYNEAVWHFNGETIKEGEYGKLLAT